MEFITIVTCMIQVYHFLVRLQRSDREVCHMVQQLSPAAQYQQNQISLGWTTVVFSVQAQ